VRLILISLLALSLAAVVGVGITWMTATKGTDLGTLTIGAWTARPKTGTADIDPYSRATIVRNGELPIGTGDGVAFTATTDDRRKPLDGRCDVVVSGVTPLTTTSQRPSSGLFLSSVVAVKATPSPVPTGSSPLRTIEARE